MPRQRAGLKRIFTESGPNIAGGSDGLHKNSTARQPRVEAAPITRPGELWRKLAHAGADFLVAVAVLGVKSIGIRLRPYGKHMRGDLGARSDQSRIAGAAAIDLS